MSELLIAPIVTFVSFVIPFTISFFILRGYLKKIVAENLAKNEENLKQYSETKDEQCMLHGGELDALKNTNRVMLECHETQLMALDNISKGVKMNGEIGAQQKKLRAHMYANFGGIEMGGVQG